MVTLIIVALYMIPGIIFAEAHMRELIAVLKNVKQRNIYLREMVEMYGMSPTGGEYYAELQEHELQYKLMLSEYEKYESGVFLYYLRIGIPYALMWPLFLYDEIKMKKRQSS